MRWKSEEEVVANHGPVVASREAFGSSFDSVVKFLVLRSTFEQCISGIWCNRSADPYTLNLAAFVFRLWIRLTEEQTYD
jgi:hypothetical protein